MQSAAGGAPRGDGSGTISLEERFEILRRLGEGAAGAVFLARRRKDGIEVAIKVLHGDCDAIPQMQERFAQEARLLATIQSPNVVCTLGAGRSDQGLYLVMEYLPGMDLSDLISEQHPLPRDRALEICRGLARGLVDIHAAGVIHRDLKPANVIVTTEGVPRIADFGLAKGPLQSGIRTKTGLILGTPGYLSVEQILGGRPTTASDIYALGLVIYFVFAGEPAFQHENLIQVLKQQQRGLDAGRLRKLPEDVAELVVRMTAPQPEERPDASTCLDLLFEMSGDVPRAERTATRTYPAPGSFPPAAPGAARTIESRDLAGTRRGRSVSSASASSSLSRPGTGPDRESTRLASRDGPPPTAGAGPATSASSGGPPLRLLLPSALVGLVLLAAWGLRGGTAEPGPALPEEAPASPLDASLVRQLGAIGTGALVRQALDSWKEGTLFPAAIESTDDPARQTSIRAHLLEVVQAQDWVRTLEVVRTHASEAWWHDLPADPEARGEALRLRRDLVKALLRLRLLDSTYRAMHPHGEVPGPGLLIPGLDEVLAPVLRLGRQPPEFQRRGNEVAGGLELFPACQVLGRADFEDLANVAKLLGDKLMACEGLIEEDLIPKLERDLPPELPHDAQGFTHFHVGLYDLFPRGWIHLEVLTAQGGTLLDVPLHLPAREASFKGPMIVFGSGEGAHPVTLDVAVHRSLLEGGRRLALTPAPLYPDDLDANGEMRALVAGIGLTPAATPASARRPGSEAVVPLED